MGSRKSALQYSQLEVSQLGQCGDSAKMPLGEAQHVQALTSISAQQKQTTTTKNRGGIKKKGNLN